MTVACFTGGERDKEAPPGLPGGLCLGPDGSCNEGTCHLDRNYCYDIADPCDGFFCGGEERGSCVVDSEAQPSCVCLEPYTDEVFDLYCCPSEGSGIIDPRCVTDDS